MVPLYKRVPRGYPGRMTVDLLILNELFKMNEIRRECGLPSLKETATPHWERAQHVRRMQNQHEKTVQLMKDYEDMQDVLEKFDHRIHWLDWDSIEEGKATIAYCGAVVHDSTTWVSHGALFNLLDTVTCEDCCALPEYNLKLLAQTDLGDTKEISVSMHEIKPTMFVGEVTEVVPMSMPEGILDYLDVSYGSDK